MSGNRKSTHGRWLALVLAGIMAGSLLGGPAVAHVGRRMKHLIAHLDPLYVNENQQAADANQLDGVDSSEFLRGASTQSRQFTCPGSGFFPLAAFSYVTAADGERYLDTTSGNVRCKAHLPNNAVVTGVSFTVFDGDAATDVTNCVLARTDLTVPVTTATNVSDPVATSGDVDDEVISASSLVSGNTTIANSQFAYYLDCFLGSGDVLNGIYGAVVTYDVSAANG